MMSLLQGSNQSTQKPARDPMGFPITGQWTGRRNEEGGDHAQSLSMGLGCMGLARRRGLGTSAGAVVISRPAHSPGGRIPARRGNGHPCPPGHPRTGRGARPVRRHREQAGRGRIHRLELCRGGGPDGYTLLMAENALGISQALYKKTSSSFDPVKQYDAIAVVATSPLVLAVANNVEANSVNELIAYSRKVPQKINYASAGIGSVSHLTFEVIKASTGMEAVHVPYKGGGPAMNDVIAGHVAINMASIQVAKGLIETGKIKGLAVTSAERSPVLPNVPTLKEAGVKTADVDLRFWFGLFAPKDVPDAIKAKLDKAVATTLSNPQVRERLANLDIEPAYAPGDSLKTKLENEIANWTKFIDAHGIKPE